MYYFGKRNLQRDLDRAVKYYEMGAENKDPEGLYNLGISKLRVRNILMLGLALVVNVY